jgi:hypothetical protein
LDDVQSAAESLRADLAEADSRILQLKKTGIYIVDKQDEVRAQIEELVKPFINA